MEKIKISVIIPVYNVEKYLRKCLYSVVSQKYENLEIILVDDGSTDNSAQICDEFANNDSRIKVIHKENGGVSSARNFGLNICVGDYISFVDSDDWLEADFYKWVNDNIQNNDLLIFDYFIANEKKKRIKKIFTEEEKTFSKQECMLELAKETLKSYPFNKIYNRNIFNDLRFPEGKNYEDQAIMHLIIHKCNKIEYVSKAYYNYYQNPNSITHTVSEKNYKDYLYVNFKRGKFLKKYYPEIYKYHLNTIYSGIAKLCWFYFGKDKYKIRYAFLKKVIFKRFINNLMNSRISMKAKVKMLLALLNIDVIKILYSKQMLTKLIERQR